MKKRILSTLLAFCMMLALLPGTAWAKRQETVAKPGHFSSVSIGSQHTAAIDVNGVLWTWGLNSWGQLGTGESGPRLEYNSLVPVRIMDDVISVACNHHVTAAIKNDFSLWMWGSNYSGELGNGTTEESNVPIKVMENVTAVCFGDNLVDSVAAIKTDGSLWTWGYNGLHNLGIGSDGNDTVTNTNGIGCQTIPVKILDDVVSVTMASDKAAAIKADGSLWIWGYGLNIEQAESPFQTVPLKVMDDVSKVSLSSDNAAVIKTDGSLWMWGNNYSGQLGIDSTDYEVKTPVKVMDNVIDVNIGTRWVAAVKTDGSLWTWGANEWGTLGNGMIDNSSVPVKVMDNAALVSTNSTLTTVIKTDGSLWAWGLDPEGYLLGNGGITNATSKGGQPCQTLPVQILTNVAAISQNDFSVSIALKTDGSIWAWGDRYLGNGLEAGSKIPIKIDLTVKQPITVIPPSVNPSPASIVSMFPANGATDVGFDASNPPEFRITFDKEINTPDDDGRAEVDLTAAGAFAICRKEDDQLIWKPSEYSGSNFTIVYGDKNTLVVKPTNRHALLEPNTEYYVTMDEGFVKFKDGTTNAAIRKGDWSFTTTTSSVSRPGDITGDGDISIGDVVKLARAVAGYISLTPQERAKADVTGDGDITIGDVVKLARYVAGYIHTL